MRNYLPSYLRTPLLRSDLTFALMLFGLFLTTLSFPAVSFAQNSISGKLINGPGSSTQDIPSRWVTMDKHELFPAGIASSDTQTNSSEAYSFSYSGGPFFSFDEIDIYVNPGLNPNLSAADASCITQNDINEINAYVAGTTTLTNLQKVAADVNIDGVVSLVDRDMLLDLVLGNIEYYTNSISVGGTIYNDRSIVYPTTSEVASLSDTFNLTYTYKYTDPNIPTGSNSGKDFYSIRLGDVSGNCSTYAWFQDGEEDFDFKRTVSRGTRSKNHSPKTILYPNPVISDLSVRSIGTTITEIEILDLSGRILFQKNFEGKSKNIILSGTPILKLNSGTYFLNVIHGDGTKITEKFVKQ